MAQSEFMQELAKRSEGKAKATKVPTDPFRIFTLYNAYVDQGKFTAKQVAEDANCPVDEVLADLAWLKETAKGQVRATVLVVEKAADVADWTFQVDSVANFRDTYLGWVREGKLKIRPRKA